MRSRSRAPGWRPGRLFTLVSVSVVFLLLVPYGVGILSQARAAPPPLPQPAVGTVTASVFWNGVNVASYPNPSSAVTWSFDNLANVKFVWPAAGAVPSTVQISQAFLVILFLGFPAYTKQQVESVALSAGVINMTYDLTEFKWYLQGIFEVHAYLENPSGNSVWGEDFYVRVAQPYDIVVATVGLILLTIAELYLIATVGPRALDKTRKQTPPPKATEPSTGPTDSQTSSAPPEKS
jgi:hypothetical protein